MFGVILAFDMVCLVVILPKYPLKDSKWTFYVIVNFFGM
jgi:hypothetical protein